MKVKIEDKHATTGILGSVGANRSDPQNGGVADQLPYSVEEWTPAMIEELRDAGSSTGGCNFDAKVRRQSTDAVDLFHGQIGGMDIITQGLLNGAKI